jgi:hypothetical protein
MKNRNYIKTFEDKTSELNISDVSTRFLILSGEGGHQTENQFVMELNTLEEANEEFDKLKKGEFDGTYLYIYEAKKLREE